MIQLLHRGPSRCFAASGLLTLISLTHCATPASARTIVLTDQDCEQIAVISADAPRLSWAGVANAAAEYGNHVLDLTPKQSFLIRYPIDRIPTGQRITKAEWVVPLLQVSPAAGVRVQVRRLLAEWGPGVSHLLRMARPARTQWHTPGAKGVGQDRAAQATAVATFKSAGDQTFNVTQDVELWYTGAAPNRGWILTSEDQDTWLRLASPFWGAPKGFKLRITYEPE